MSTHSSKDSFRTDEIFRIEAALMQRVQQQKAIVKLGEDALSDLEEIHLLRSAAKVITDELGATACSILERMPDGVRFRRRAGHGWPGPPHEQVILEGGPRSFAGYTLKQREPLVSLSLLREERFRVPDELLALDITSGACVIIGNVSEPFGAICVYRREPQTFDQQDLDLLMSIANILGAAISNRRVRRELETLNQNLQERVHERAGYVELMQQIAAISNEARSSRDALQQTVRAICEHIDCMAGHVYLPTSGQNGEDDAVELVTSGIWHFMDEEGSKHLYRVTQEAVFVPGNGLPGRVYANGHPLWIPNVAEDPAFSRGRMANIGVGAAFAFPILAGRDVLAVPEFFFSHTEELNWALIGVMRQIGTQLGRVFEREMAEASLRQSEARFRSIAQAAPDALIVSDSSGRVSLWNQSAEKMFGYTAEEIVGQSISHLMPEPYRVHHEQAIANLEAGNEPRLMGQILELEGLRRDGSVFPLELTLGMWQADDEQFYSGILRDVSDRHRMISELVKSERRLAEAQRIAHMGSWEWDIEHDDLLWSSELRQIFGVDPEETELNFESFISRVHEDDRELVIGHVVACREDGVPLDFIHRIVRNDEIRWIQGRGEVVYNDEGVPVRLVGTAQDITERTTAEMAAQHSNSMLVQTLDSLSAHVAVLDEEGEILSVNQAWRTFGSQNRLAWDDYCVGHNYLEVCDTARGAGAENARRAAKGIRAVLSGKLQQFRMEYECHGQKEDRWFVLRVTSFADYEPRRLVVAHENVSEIKIAEAALRQSEARFRSLFENSSIGMALADATSQPLASNRVLQQLLGLENEEILRRGLGGLVRPEDREALTSAVDSLKSGHRERVVLEVRLIREAADPLWAQVTMAAVQEQRENPVLIIAMFADISEQKRIEAELQQARVRLAQSREAERLHLAQELHDGPIQDLNGIIFGLQALTVYSKPSDQETLYEMRDALQQSIRSLRALCGELRPPTLTPFGLAVAIRSHVEQFKLKEPEADVILDLDSDGQTLPEWIRLSLFRITQQSLDNVSQHAKASQIEIKFKLESDWIILSIHDDGVGFDASQSIPSLARKGHLGLLGISERVSGIGGYLEVHSTPGEGTVIRTTVPRAQIESEN